MRIKIVKSRVLEMTREEAEKFLKLVQQAVEGRTVHSASTGLSDGTQLCVSVLTPEQEKAEEFERAERENRLANQREAQRWERQRREGKTNGGNY
jgi:hypothetical protein